MRFGISGLSLIPVRKEPSERSEMVTQILFGEHFEVIDYLPGWSHIRLAYDDYEGWIDFKMITPLSESRWQKIEKSPNAVTTDIFTLIPGEGEQHLMLVAGSTLPFWRPNLRQFSINDSEFKMPASILPSPGHTYRNVKDSRNLIIAQALKYFNAPYLWGGRSPFGIDCSGLTQVIYKMAGIKIPRDAGQQVHAGTPFSFVEEGEPGDLAFFDDDEGRIVHVGILWNRKKIIHASGKVRIDNVDQYGIFNVETKRYTHKLRVMKKII
jgi:gamma-D-glutamyl-L-lysine dipeptidyl-peptidase